MIHNPYPIPTSDDDKAACRFQTYLSGKDRALLFGIRPIRGTPQAVINNLIKNLCDELRELNITDYRPDADDIFSILVERRALSPDQLSRIRRTIDSTDKQVPARVQQHSGGSGVRERATSTTSGANHPPFQVVRGKQPNSQKKSKTKKGRG